MDWLELLGQIFEIAIIPMLGALGVYVVSLINTKKEELKEKTKNETVKKYIDMLNDTISECVVATTQTYVASLKEQGEFDAEAQKIALQKTYENVMIILNDEAKEYLTEAVGDLNSYILNKIEVAVVTNK